MQAHVRHRLELHLLVAQDHDGLCADARRQVVAGCLQRACAADALPFAFEDIALFQRRGIRPTYRHRGGMECASLNGRSQPACNASTSRCSAIVRAGSAMEPSLINPCGSASTRGIAALRSSWSEIYQAKLPAKILFLDTKAKFLPMQRAQLRRRFRHSTCAYQIMRRHADAGYRFRRTTQSAARLVAASWCATAQCPASSQLTSSLNRLMTKSSPSTVRFDLSGKFRML